MKNKILSIFIVVSLFVFTFSSNVFASSDIKCPSCDVNLSTNLDYDFSGITESAGKHLGLITAVKYNNENYIIAYWSYDNNYHNVKPYINNGVVFMEGTYNTMIYKVVDGSLVHQGWSGGLFEKNGFDDLGKNSVVYSSTSDIYKDSSLNDVFFYKPPVNLEEVLIQEQKKKATVQEILGVLPPILVVVVSFLGLRKALKMLLTLLRRCLSL